jgi:hypothetical protein
MNPRDLLKLAGGIFDDRKKTPDADAETERKWREYLASARKRCLEYRELRYCEACHHSMHAFQSFCEKCGKATEPLPAAFAVEYASAEFPELVKSREDFDKLISMEK